MRVSEAPAGLFGTDGIRTGLQLFALTRFLPSEPQATSLESTRKGRTGRVENQLHILQRSLLASHDFG